MMGKPFRVCGCAGLLACLFAGSSGAALRADDRSPVQELHVSTTGDDGAAGTAEQPLLTLPRALKLVKDSGRVVLHAGTYVISRRLDLQTNGISISAAPGETVLLEPEGSIRSVFHVSVPDVSIEGLTIDGKFVESTGAVRALQSAKKLKLRNCEIRNFTRHMVDIDGDDSLVEGCHIHHGLWVHNGERTDAHGIVTEHCRRLRIDNCQIDHVSGDTFQAGRGDWQDIVIADCHFWDGPLEQAMAGFPAGIHVAENAIDTKLDTKVERGRLTLKNCRFHGFRSTLIKNTAALNLKENADVVVDSCVVSDSEVGFRLRGTNHGGVWVTVVNCTIRDCDVGIRHEDNLENLRLVHNTMLACRTLFVRAPSRSRIGQGWVIANNLLLDISRFPDEVRSANNQAVSAKLLDAESLRPPRVDRLLGRPVPNAVPRWYGEGVTLDQAGEPRSAERPTMGAFERPAEAAK